MRHPMRALFVICGMILTLGACTLTQTASQPLRFGPNPTWVGHAPFFLAADQKFYGSTQVETITFSSLYDAYRAFSQRRVDAIGTTMLDAIRMADEGIPAQVVMIMNYSSGADGIAARDSIASVSELKGKRVGVALGDLNHFVLLAALDKAGLKESDVTLVNLPVEESAKAFAKGDIDAATLWEPLLSQEGNRPGAHTIFTSAEIPGMVIDVVVVQKDIAEQRPSDVANLVLGWDRAMQLWRTDKTQAVAIMARAEAMTPEAFEQNIVGVEFVDMARNRDLFNRSDEHSIWNTYDKTANFMLQHGILKKSAPAPAEQVLNANFLTSVGQ